MDEDDVTMATAKEAMLSKMAASQLGYFEDEFLVHFCRNKQAPRKPPIINRGYFGRVECINSAGNAYVFNIAYRTCSIIFKPTLLQLCTTLTSNFVVIL